MHSKTRRLSGRLSNAPSPSLKAERPFLQSLVTGDGADSSDAHGGSDTVDLLIDQVSAWIKEERAKRSKRKTSQPEQEVEHEDPVLSEKVDAGEPHERRGSNVSEDSFDLDKLESIIKQNLSIRTFPTRSGSTISRRKPSIKRLRRKPSSTSDTDYYDGDVNVPTCDVVLDNSKTLAYTGGAPDSSDESSSDELRREPSYRDQDAWAKFKFEIIRLSHTLRLKGWRRVPMEMSAAIDVQRLSGALTNAVYVISPPTDLSSHKTDDASTTAAGKAPPPKLLLRIYGPQVEHLIDREAELAILKRLARKRIGPRLLGTFANGRFEEFFHAQTLTAEDLRNAETSRQIAKRMRELHQGIELLDQERSDGAFVWRNWDKWLPRLERVVSWMDDQLKSLEPSKKPTGANAWLRRGFICGTPWAQFKEVVEKYRVWLKSQYGGSKQVRGQLVFSHNDTQYGNILRLIPTGESPLLLPANTHKQLVVIDFEYASANTPGLEFANHFTEWCYNYHDKRKPYACNVQRYPTPEEQNRFLRAYVQHRPQFNVSSPPMRPQNEKEPVRRSTTSLSNFILDARTPTTPSMSSDDGANKAVEDAEIARLAQEARWWRLANTIQWIAWGIIQAKVPGMPQFDGDNDPASEETEPVESNSEKSVDQETDKSPVPTEDPTPENGEEEEEEEEEAEEEFDYLGYAQHRAMFFWGDALQLGFIEPDDLPEEARSKVKTVPY